jgi:UDPglucose--hexose-1-phosphate uridylyltransferase
MPELRQDPITSTWVVIATERAKRPSDFAKKPEERKGPDSCPFCYGHEFQTPPEVMAYRDPGTAKDQPGWRIRVVPNKFPALSSQVNLERWSGDDALYRLEPGYGVHEVIIETPDHDAVLGKHTTEQMRLIVRALRDRYTDLRQDQSLRYIQVFKNHGAVAGASLEHPHFQLIGTPVIPTAVMTELKGSLEYYQDQKECVYCQMIRREFMENERVIESNRSFVAFCPFSSRSPFETWILPKSHSSDFSTLTEQEADDLATILGESFERLVNSLENPPFNLVLHTAPTDLQATEYYHWHLEVIPRLTIFAGFELGSGVYINPTPPETAAKFLKVVPAEIH